MIAPTYYASGSNRPADIRGFSSVGHPIGVAAPELSPAAEAELVKVRVPVFVDSGAFSEVTFGPDGPTVVKPITDAEWRARLALYARLAAKLGSQVSLVAPDRVGDQAETLARLARYAPELRALRATGARILVCIQKGPQTQAAFYRQVVAVLGFDDFVHAIPSKKKATTMAELEAYVREVKPRAVHLLGLGLRNANAPAALAILAGVGQVSLDSNVIAANVGRSEASPRKLSAARDRAAWAIASGLNQGPDAPTHVQELAIVSAFFPAGDAFLAACRAGLAPRHTCGQHFSREGRCVRCQCEACDRVDCHCRGCGAPCTVACDCEIAWAA